MSTKYFCYGLISLHVNFHGNRTKWTVISKLKNLQVGGGGGKEKEPKKYFILFFLTFNFLMLLLLHKTLKGSRNIQGFALIRVVLFYFEPMRSLTNAAWLSL